jgi:hypothetical protein
MLGPVLGTEVGSDDTDGFVLGITDGLILTDGVTDGLILTDGAKLGESLGEIETEGLAEPSKLGCSLGNTEGDEETDGSELGRIDTLGI